MLRFTAKFASSLSCLAAALLAAVPAHAAGGTPLPEPSSLLLLGIGVTGVVVGRRLAHRKGRD